ncbi:hypothetical protein [Novosphingobium olei]|uniref:Uncharacterized protein n=1 Tax=Novosphingobium olei TaxID=2728851 RepID=A0A7Y0BT59_9SPHN|nr:hypothetical protein [Novosphingobium olei]NML96086.1 hypothetical protein [Novosphingobium olei]
MASQAVEAGNHSLVVRVVAAFDVLDDSLDHAPDRDHTPTVQQQVIVGLPCLAKTEQVLFVALGGAWTVLDFVLPSNRILSELFRPPRA